MSQALFSTLEHKVAVARQGDQQAFAQLIEATQNLTTTVALSIVKDVDASEDVAQQVYIKVWQQLPSLKQETSFLPWLRQMTRYTAINYLRDNKVGQRMESDQAERILEGLSVDADALDGQLNKAQMSQLLAGFIDDLPDENRELVLLYYREEESTRQVAGLLELSEANVRQKLSRSRQLIKTKWLAKYGKLALTTSPGLGFTALMMNLVSTSTPVAAATLTASASAGKTGFWGKWLALLGGAVIGGATAILAVLLSTEFVTRQIQDKSYVPHIKRNRNRMIAWIALCSVLLFVSYEFTAGWWAPVLSYCLFAIGLVRLVELSQLLTMQAGIKKPGRFCLDGSSNRWWVRLMNWSGPLAGGIGLVMGLIGSGKL